MAQLPLATTLGAMGVAGLVAQPPERLIGIGSFDIARAMAAIREVRQLPDDLAGQGARRPRTLGLGEAAAALVLGGNAQRVCKLA